MADETELRAVEAVIALSVLRSARRLDLVEDLRLAYSIEWLRANTDGKRHDDERAGGR
jgi:hypothetical protein